MHRPRRKYQLLFFVHLGWPDVPYLFAHFWRKGLQSLFGPIHIPLSLTCYTGGILIVLLLNKQRTILINSTIWSPTYLLGKRYNTFLRKQTTQLLCNPNMKCFAAWLMTRSYSEDWCNNKSGNQIIQPSNPHVLPYSVSHGGTLWTLAAIPVGHVRTGISIGPVRGWETSPLSLLLLLFPRTLGP